MNAEHDNFDFKPEKAHIDILRYLTQLWMDDPENCSRTREQIADGVGVPFGEVIMPLVDLIREDMVWFHEHRFPWFDETHDIASKGIMQLARWRAEGEGA